MSCFFWLTVSVCVSSFFSFSSPLSFIPLSSKVGTLEGVYHLALEEEAGEHMPERTAALAGEEEVQSYLLCSLPGTPQADIEGYICIQ